MKTQKCMFTSFIMLLFYCFLTHPAIAATIVDHGDWGRLRGEIAAAADGTVFLLTEDVVRGPDDLQIEIGGNRSIALTGSGDVTIRGTAAMEVADGRLFLVGDRADVTIRNLTLAGGRLYEGRGGAVAVVGDAPRLTMVDCTLRDNIASGDNSGGAAVDIGLGGAGSFLNCTISENKSAGGLGGAVSVYGQTARATFVNCTISGNDGTGSPGVGAIYAYDAATVRMLGSTVTGNYSVTNSGGVYVMKSANISMAGSIVAGNTRTLRTGSGQDIIAIDNLLLYMSGTLHSYGYNRFDGGITTNSNVNLWQDTDRSTDVTSAEIFPNVSDRSSLYPAENGGPAATVAIRPDGAAARVIPQSDRDSWWEIVSDDHAIDLIRAVLGQDARGVKRPQPDASGGQTSAGAFEPITALPAPTLSADRTPIRVGDTVRLTATLSGIGTVLALPDAASTWAEWDYDGTVLSFVSSDAAGRPETYARSLRGEVPGDFPVTVRNAYMPGSSPSTRTIVIRSFVSPDMPQGLAALPGAGSVLLSWQAPADDGGRPIARYETALEDGAWQDVGTALSHRYDGLENGREYGFQVRAVNTGGLTGPAAAIRATPQAQLASTALTRLDSSAGTLSPPFSPGTTSYTAKVDHDVAQLTLTPIPAEPDAVTVTVNGAPLVSGAASVPLAIGVNRIDILVADRNAPSNSTTYALAITRATSPGQLASTTLARLDISAGTLSPPFSPGTTGYTANVDHNVAQLTLTPVPTEPDAVIVTVNGAPLVSGAASVPLAIGANRIDILVADRNAPSNSTTYTLTMTRNGIPRITPEDDGTVNATIPVTDADGNGLQVVDIPQSGANEAALAALSAIGLSLRHENGNLVLSGVATDIGSFEIEVLVEDAASNQMTLTVIIEIEAIERTEETGILTDPAAWRAATWTDRDNPARVRFRLDVPTEVGEADARRAKDVGATLEGNDVRLASSPGFLLTDADDARGVAMAEGVPIRIEGSALDRESVVVKAVTYRLGIHRYTQSTDVHLAEFPQEGGHVGGSGCAAGGGCFTLAVLSLAGRMLRRGKGKRSQAKKSVRRYL